MRILVVVVALLYGWIGLTGHGWDRLWGIAGGVLILAALLLARRSGPAALVLLVLGALPLAVATWWSIVTPVLALVVLPVGAVAILRLPPRATTDTSDTSDTSALVAP